MIGAYRQMQKLGAVISTTRGALLSTSSGGAPKFVVVGAGAGGLAVGSWVRRKYGENSLTIIDPAENHYYQPMFTLVGGGAKTLSQSTRPMESLIPSDSTWLQTSVKEFKPDENVVVTTSGERIGYDYLVVAMGLDIKYDQIKGLKPLLDDPNSMVATNYSPKYAPKTFKNIQAFNGGTAIFTMPPLPVKCPGAPQKIMYLAEDYWRKNGIRDKTKVLYNSSLGVIFGVKKYANSLLYVIGQRDIDVNFHTMCIEVTDKEAIFKNTQTDEIEPYQYDFLHVSPPQGPHPQMKGQPIADEAGWVTVDKTTLQHTKYSNVFGIGDCTNVPTSKTAAAVAAESAVLKQNISAVVNGISPKPIYDGYTSCPLITGYGKTILAEFDFNANPLETFPFDQGRERWSMYQLKAEVMPELYWEGLLKGVWGGPAQVRKLLSFGTRE